MEKLNILYIGWTVTLIVFGIAYLTTSVRAEYKNFQERKEATKNGDFAEGFDHYEYG